MRYTEEEARALVIEAGHKLLETELIARTWGNISCRISETEFIITPSGRAYDNLRPEELVKCKIADCSYEGDIKPSSEKGIHADGYRLRPDCNFIIHTHQFYATIVGVTGDDIQNPFVPCASYGIPSTGKLRRAVAKAVEANPDSKAVLMTRHGAMCMGADYEEAFKVAFDLEEVCKRTYEERCGKFIGKEIDVVSHKRKTLHPPIDDLAQIAGTTIRCVSAGEGDEAVKRALKGRNAVLVCGGEPVCTGPDASAVRMLLEKGCAAACFAGTMKGLSWPDAFLQRTIYVKKYSKRK